MQDLPHERDFQTQWQLLSPHLDERGRRLLAATGVVMLGRGGLRRVEEITGMAKATLRSGVAELNGELLPTGRIRRPGAGRPRSTVADPGLSAALDALIDPGTRGDPESPLRWTTKSLSTLAAELLEQGHKVSRGTIRRLLVEKGFSLQANSKTFEGGDHPDRDAQFQKVHDLVASHQNDGQPVISVDAKKKELVGNFRNAGAEWLPEGEPTEVNVYDFVGELGKVTPYGVYDVTNNEAWVSVGTDHDTSAFAVESILRWWTSMGRPRYPEATRLLITADGGGSNGSRVRLWKKELQRLADDTGLTITVCHFPPGTSKWNKIEHRLFSHISMNWRGRPLVNHETVVNLIAATRTSTGLTVRAELDRGPYAKGIKVSDEEMGRIQIQRDVFHGEWNYKISPMRAP